jgi:murein L,D-transpeptidase YcbB/YkuD
VKNFQTSHGLGAEGIVGNASGPALTIVAQQGDSGAKPVNSQQRKPGSDHGFVEKPQF